MRRATKSIFKNNILSSLFLSTLSLRRATNPRKMIVSQVKISIHALLAESDLHCNTPNVLRHYFYPRSPCGERRLNLPSSPIDKNISIHALLAESDFNSFSLNINGPLFLSTLSLRRATHYDNYNLHCTEISIHALLAESDGQDFCNRNGRANFYPRSPCGERLTLQYAQRFTTLFLSTLSLRRATTSAGWL